MIEIIVINPGFVHNINCFTGQPQTLGKRDVVMFQQRRLRGDSWQAVGMVLIAYWRPSLPTFAFKVIGASKRANSSPAVHCLLENRNADVHAVARKSCRGSSTQSGNRGRRGGQVAHTHQPLQRAPRMAGPRPQETPCRRRLRQARRLDRRANSGTVAGLEFGACKGRRKGGEGQGTESVP